MGLLASLFTHFLLILPVEISQEPEWVFVGCGWSPSECRYFCPQLGSFKAQYRPDLCELDFPAEWACYCANE